ncbi:MAG: type II toxin-antitoxin system VapB family antitoxin [Bradymonadaceae bacterium]
MRTTITVDDELFEEFMELTGADTKAEAVRGAIEECVRARRREQLLELRGEVDVVDDLDELRALDEREPADDDRDD